MKRRSWLPLIIGTLATAVLVSIIVLIAFLAIPQPAIVNNVEYILGDSREYSHEDLMAATSVIIEDFKRFDECELLTIRYDEDFSDLEHSLSMAPEHSIVFTIDFYANPNAGDGLNKDYTYTDFKYYLERVESNGVWRVITSGYA